MILTSLSKNIGKDRDGGYCVNMVFSHGFLSATPHSLIVLQLLRLGLAFEVSAPNFQRCSAYQDDLLLAYLPYCSALVYAIFRPLRICLGHREQHGSKKKLRNQHEPRANKRPGNEWNSIWTEYSRKPSRNPTAAQMAPLNHKRPLGTHTTGQRGKRLDTHGEIGLADFPYRQRVPGITSSECPCGWHRQTAKHVILSCLLKEIRELLLRRRRNSSCWISSQWR